MNDPDSPAALFVASFNRDLATLRSPARVALPGLGTRQAVLEMHDQDGNLLCLVPEATSPEMVAIAYRLYAHALNRGIVAGEQSAWAKLRYLIGAAADHADT